MPTYDYRCPDCDARFEQVRPISQSGEGTECPACGAEATRAFSPVGVVFKGSGFHTTDYRDRPKELPPKDATSEATSSEAPCSASSSADKAACDGCPKAT
jgi:putative FmdB family regulatory protein